MTPLFRLGALGIWNQNRTNGPVVQLVQMLNCANFVCRVKRWLHWALEHTGLNHIALKIIQWKVGSRWTHDELLPECWAHEKHNTWSLLWCLEINSVRILLMKLRTSNWSSPILITFEKDGFVVEPWWTIGNLNSVTQPDHPSPNTHDLFMVFGQAWASILTVDLRSGF